jgi:uncharacterized protein YdhG (YjbR/CyaY superfamily)
VPAVDDYFSSLDASARAAFEHIRDLVMEMAPEAEQGTSYGWPRSGTTRSHCSLSGLPGSI